MGHLLGKNTQVTGVPDQSIVKYGHRHVSEAAQDSCYLTRLSWLVLAFSVRHWLQA